VWWWYKNLAEFTLEWEMPHFSQAEKDAIFPLLNQQKSGKFDPKIFNDADMIVVGDPDQCLAKMLKYAELGVDQLICYVQFGHLPHESIMRTIELLGTEIIPQLKKREVHTDVTVKANGSRDPADLDAVKRVVD
jgi:hypothetical protein